MKSSFDWQYAILRSGYKRKFIADELHISVSSLNNKIRGITEFKVSEAFLLGQILNLSTEELRALCFARKVENNSTCKEVQYAALQTIFDSRSC